VTIELLPHTADLRVALRAPDLATLYAAAVNLVRELLVGDSPVAARQERSVDLGVIDEAERFFRFVRELLYLYDTERFVPARLTDEKTLAVGGEPFDPERHVIYHEAKAVTRHGYTFGQTADGYEVELVVDL